MDSRQAFQFLLRLYPRDFRASFAAEMSIAFEAALNDRGSFAAGEFGALALGAAIEWIAKLTTDTSVRGRILPDRLLMRPPAVSWEAHWGKPR